MRPLGGRIAVVGQTISHFEIIERIGDGGMGVVYRARDLTLDRYVALKFLPKSLSGEGRRKRNDTGSNPRLRFVQEAKAASALDHPNICTVYAIDQTDDGQLFIAMAWYDGETLKKRIKRGPLSLREISDLGSQIAAGLSAAHERGIIHRDIKPANVMVTRDGTVKILDFGLSKFIRGPSELTQTGAVMGTAAYMAPEQVKEETVDERTDVWALGVVLYEMATGKKPFRGTTEMSVLYAVVNREPELTDESIKTLPPDLRWIILKALAKDPDERYQSMAELQADLEALHPDSQSITLPSRSLRSLLSWSQLKRRARRIRRPLGLAFGALVLLVLGGFLRNALNRPPPASEAPRVELAASERVAIEPLRPLDDADGADPTLGLALRDLLTFALPADDALSWVLVGDGDHPSEAELAIDGDYRLRPEHRGRELAIELRLRHAGNGSASGEDATLLRAVSIAGPPPRILSMVSHLAQELGRDLGHAPRPGPVDGVGAPEPTSAQARSLWDQVQAALRIDDAPSALRRAEAAITIEPDFPGFHDARAVALSRLGRFDEATAAAERALALARDLPWACQLSFWVRRLEVQMVPPWPRIAALLDQLWLHAAGDWSLDERREQGLRLAVARVRSGRPQAALELLAELRRWAPEDPRVGLVEAEAAQRQSLFPAQLAAARWAAAAAQRAGAPLLLAEALLYEGLALRREGDDEQALAVIERARALFADGGVQGRGGEATALNVQGMIYWDRQDLLQAQTHYEKAAQIFSELGDKRMSGPILHNIALILRQYGNVDAALDVFQSSIELMRETSYPHLSLALLNLAELYLTTGRLDQAEAIFEEAGEVARTSTPINQAAVAMGRSELMILRGESLAEAEKRISAALEIFRRSGEVVYTSDSLVRYGTLRRLQGDLRDAQQAFEEAGDLVRDKDVNFAQAQRALGEVLITQNELQPARVILEDALAGLYRADHPFRGMVLLSLAWLALADGDPAKAAERAREAVGDLERGSLPLEAARACGILAQALLELDRRGEAEVAIEKGYALLGDLDETEAVLYRLPVAIADARRLALGGEMEEARAILQRLLAIATKLQVPEIELETLLAQGEIELLAGEANHGILVHLQRVERKAKDKGFYSIASRAAAARLRVDHPGRARQPSARL
ncbi:MAG: serine/threonine protein kinase [Acidobacteria bacterium]|nr:MAG: serine/threonine protein kinase [Acidobacteriota bacterium]